MYDVADRSARYSTCVGWASRFDKPLRYTNLSSGAQSCPIRAPHRLALFSLVLKAQGIPLLCSFIHPVLSIRVSQISRLTVQCGTERNCAIQSIRMDLARKMLLHSDPRCVICQRFSGANRQWFVKQTV